MNELTALARQLLARKPTELQVEPELSEFLADIPEKRTDNADSMASVSGMSVPFPKNPGEKASPPLPDQAPLPPLHPGWLVVYRDRTGRLLGGSDERDRGTVQACTWDGIGWTIILTNGDRLPLRIVTAVSMTDAAGRIVKVWTVREHGYDGEGRGRE